MSDTLNTNPELQQLAERIACSLWGYFNGGSDGSCDTMKWFENHKTSGGPAHVIERVRQELNDVITRKQFESVLADAKALKESQSELDICQRELDRIAANFLVDAQEGFLRQVDALREATNIMLKVFDSDTARRCYTANNPEGWTIQEIEALYTARVALRAYDGVRKTRAIIPESEVLKEQYSQAVEILRQCRDALSYDVMHRNCGPGSVAHSAYIAARDFTDQRTVTGSVPASKLAELTAALRSYLPLTGCEAPAGNEDPFYYLGLITGALGKHIENTKRLEFVAKQYSNAIHYCCRTDGDEWNSDFYGTLDRTIARYEKYAAERRMQKLAEEQKSAEEKKQQ